MSIKVPKNQNNYKKYKEYRYISNDSYFYNSITWPTLSQFYINGLEQISRNDIYSFYQQHKNFAETQCC